MPQLPITPAISPQPRVGVSNQTSASASSATAGEDGMGSAPALNFGAVFAKQLKGVVSLLEQKEDAGLSLATLNEIAGATVLPVDLSVLTGVPVQMAVPVPISLDQAGAEAGTLAEAGTKKPLMQLLHANDVRLAADIAVNGKNLPQSISPELQFADKLAALVEGPEGKPGGELYSAGLSVVANTSAAALRAPEPVQTLPVAPRVGSSEWGGAVGEKVLWMANQSHQVAELHLNPPNLGPLEVRLTISNDQASALFVSPHSAVREAIETALPRLREMLADNGIMLGNVTVGSESFSQQQSSDQRDGKQGGGGQSTESAMARMAVPGRHAGQARDGMVDIFA